MQALSLTLEKTKDLPQRGNDVQFYDDMLGLFMGFQSGHVGRYCYDGRNWDAVIQNAATYYVPRADKELVADAAAEIASLIPQGTSYIDFGVGGPVAFHDHVLPITRRLHSPLYVGVDYCKEALKAVMALRSIANAPAILQTVQTDFFAPDTRIITATPSLGVMNGLTVTNNYGTLDDKNIVDRFVQLLRQLSRFTNDGWLLLTIDTNQDEAALCRAYMTPMTSRLYLNVFHRMAQTLPVDRFDPTLFAYAPEWHPDIRLFAHIARATQNQDFYLGPNRLSIKKGDKFHLLNSYKFSQAFFETCAQQAGLTIQHVWNHETPMKLFLLAGAKGALKSRVIYH